MLSHKPSHLEKQQSPGPEAEVVSQTVWHCRPAALPAAGLCLHITRGSSLHLGHSPEHTWSRSWPMGRELSSTRDPPSTLGREESPEIGISWPHFLFLLPFPFSVFSSIWFVGLCCRFSHSSWKPKHVCVCLGICVSTHTEAADDGLSSRFERKVLERGTGWGDADQLNLCSVGCNTPRQVTMALHQKPQAKAKKQLSWRSHRIRRAQACSGKRALYLKTCPDIFARAA